MAVVGVAGLVSVALGADRSIVTLDADTSAVGPGLPAGSVTAPALSCSVTVPEEHPAMLTVHSAPEPEGVPITHPVAVPETARSSVANPVTDSLKVTSYGSVVALVGVTGASRTAVGGVGSALTVTTSEPLWLLSNVAPSMNHACTACGPGAPRTRSTVAIPPPVTGVEPAMAPSMTQVTVPPPGSGVTVAVSVVGSPWTTGLGSAARLVVVDGRAGSSTTS